MGRKVVGLKQQIRVLMGWLADGKGKGDSKTSEVMGWSFRPAIRVSENSLGS